MSKIFCSECKTRMATNAEMCPECGYPVIANIEETSELRHSTLREYRLIQLFGGVAVCAGIAAAIADSPMAAAISITVGIATYIVGVLGAWWNSGD